MKGINTETLRRGKTNISLFLAVLVFCFLLFMEFETEEEGEYNEAIQHLRELSSRLKKRQNDIRTIATVTKVINDKVDEIIKMVDSAIDFLEKKCGTIDFKVFARKGVKRGIYFLIGFEARREVKKEIREAENFSKLVQKMEPFVDQFSPETYDPSHELRISLDEIKQIQNKIRETMK